MLLVQKHQMFFIQHKCCRCFLQYQNVFAFVLDFQFGIDVIKRVEKVQVMLQMNVRAIIQMIIPVVNKQHRNLDYCSLYKDKNSPLTKFVSKLEDYYQTTSIHIFP